MSTVGFERLSERLRVVIVLTIDLGASQPGARHATFGDAGAVAAADVAIWRADALLERYRAEPGTAGPVALAPLDAQALVAHSRAMRDAFRALVGRGGTLVVLLPAARVLGLHTLQEIVDFEPLEALPGPAVRIVPLVGPAARIHCDAGEPFAAFFAEAGGWLRAQTAIVAGTGRPIATDGVGGADRQVVASFEYRHPGRILLLPSSAAALDDPGRERLIDAIGRLVRRLGAGTGAGSGVDSGPPPDWVGDGTLPGERALDERVDALRRASDLARAALDDAEASRAAWRRVAALLYGDAPAAAAAFRFALPRLGGYAQPVEAAGDGDDDAGIVVFEFDGRCLALFAVDETRGAVAAALDAVDRDRRTFAEALDVPVAAVILFVGARLLPPDRRGPLAKAWMSACAARRLPIVDAGALIDGWLRADPSPLRALVDGTPTPSRGDP